jgi:hypothetical protein
LRIIRRSAAYSLVAALVTALGLKADVAGSATIQEQIHTVKQQANVCRLVRGAPWISSLGIPYTHYLERLRAWKGRRLYACWYVIPAQTRQDFICIHRYEGSWTDPKAPYWGGLQMDLTFMRNYGAPLLVRRGTADHWREHEQVLVGWIAKRSGRGYYPWPLTARYCGLIP